MGTRAIVAERHSAGKRRKEDIPSHVEIPRLAARRPSIGVKVLVGATALGIVATGCQDAAQDVPKAAATISLGKGPKPVAFAAGALWVADEFAGTLSRVDPETNKVVAEIPEVKEPMEAAVGAGSLWVADFRGIVFRIDPVTNRVTATIEVEGTPQEAAFGGGAVWVTETHRWSVLRIDPATNSVVATIRTPPYAFFLTFAAGSPWLLRDREVLRIDPSETW